MFKRKKKTEKFFSSRSREFTPALRDDITRFINITYLNETLLEETEREDAVFGALPIEPESDSGPCTASYSEMTLSAPEEQPFGLPVSEKRPLHAAGKVSAPSDRAYAPMPSAPMPSGLKSWLDNIDAPFSTTLFALIDSKGMSDAEVYKRANMSRQLFSRIRSDSDYRPAKKTVLALAIALKLTVEETRDLLERAGFALSHSNKRDIIVEYFLEEGVYDLLAINEALYEFDQPLI